MSGIYISGMKMPKEAGKYRIEFDQCGNPYLLSDNDDGGIWHIIPVPEHGDLIEKHDVFKLISAFPAVDKLLSVEFMQALYNLRTIIPSDKEVE